MKKTLYPTRPDAQEAPTLSENFFLERKVVKLFGPVTDEMADYIISALLFLSMKFQADNIPRADREINLWINSPGGSVSAGLAIYDTMRFVDCDIRTTCVGTAASMAAILLSSGTPGKREALSHSSILIHQPLGETSGQVSDILIYSKHILETREMTNEILAGNTGKSLAQIEKDTDRDNRMTAAAACAYGLIDRVIGIRSMEQDTPTFQ